jgi:hypothetical protein
MFTAASLAIPLERALARPYRRSVPQGAPSRCGCGLCVNSLRAQKNSVAPWILP